MTPGPSPFDYPSTPHLRRYNPAKYADYKRYKPWLRDEFTFRCVYCLERERWYPSRAGAFSVDHFVPQVVDPLRTTDYGNLLYACIRCNSIKGASTRLPDPTVVAFGRHLRVAPDGTIEGLTRHGKRLIEHLKLDQEPAAAVRRDALLVLRVKAKFPTDPDVHRLYVSWFGYPHDLPDLPALVRKAAVAVPGPEEDCCYTRRKRGELPEVY